MGAVEWHNDRRNHWNHRAGDRLHQHFYAGHIHPVFVCSLDAAAGCGGVQSRFDRRTQHIAGPSAARLPDRPTVQRQGNQVASLGRPRLRQTGILVDDNGGSQHPDRVVHAPDIRGPDIRIPRSRDLWRRRTVAARDFEYHPVDLFHCRRHLLSRVRGVFRHTWRRANVAQRRAILRNIEPGFCLP